MAKCKLEHFRTRHGAVEMSSRCATHDWDFGHAPKTQCPIGQIEEAAEKAIARIRADKSGDGSPSDNDTVHAKGPF